MKYIFIVAMLTTFVWSDFTRSNGVVSDTQKHLEWDDTNKKRTNWTNAIAYCENLTLNGKTDWRLPNINELFSITDYTRASMVESAFRSNSSSQYWTSTSKLYSEEDAWFIDFYTNGTVAPAGKSRDFQVRCVRTVEQI